jgi:hypothetical protein
MEGSAQLFPRYLCFSIGTALLQHVIGVQRPAGSADEVASHRAALLDRTPASWQEFGKILGSEAPFDALVEAEARRLTTSNSELARLAQVDPNSVYQGLRMNAATSAKRAQNITADLVGVIDAAIGMEQLKRLDPNFSNKTNLPDALWLRLVETQLSIAAATGCKKEGNSDSQISCRP